MSVPPLPGPGRTAPDRSPTCSPAAPRTLSARVFVMPERLVFNWVDTFCSTSNHLPMETALHHAAGTQRACASAPPPVRTARL